MASIITDTFQDTDNTLLTAHTATGDHGGFSWSFIAGSGDSDYIVNNLLTTHAIGTREYRAEVDLDSDDMYVQIDVLTLRSSTNNCVQLFIRAENDSRARYSFALFYASAGTFTYRFRIDDAITGAGDTIQTDTINATTPLTMRMEAVGNNIKCYVNENLIIDYTDESNTYQGTDYRRTGLAIRGGTNPGVSTTNIDNFEAGVLISSSPDKVFEETASGSDSIIVDKPVSVNDSAVLVDTALGGSPVVFPGATWATETPSNLGLDGSKLDAFATAIGTGIFGSGGLVIKDGYVVKQWGTADSKHHWASAKKPVFSTLLLKAVAEGFLDSVHDLVRPFVQSVYSLDLIPADQNMTFFHLANMISNYGAPNHNPGETFIYNDLAIQLYAELLFWNGGVFDLTTQDANDIIDTYFSALQFEDGDIFNSTYRVVTSNRDFARIAWLWCNKGVWNGTEIIPSTLFEQYVQNQIASDFPTSTDTDENDYLNVNDGEVNVVELSPLGPGIYGMNFWFNNFMGETSQRSFPHLPPDTFLAYGNVSGDTAIAVMIPSLRMTAVFFGQVEKVGSFNTDIGDPDSLLNSNLKLLAEAAGYSPLENEEQGVDETATATDTVRVNKSFSLEETALASEYDSSEVLYQSDFSQNQNWSSYQQNIITYNETFGGENELLKAAADESHHIYIEMRNVPNLYPGVYKIKFKHYWEGDGTATSFHFRTDPGHTVKSISINSNEWMTSEFIFKPNASYSELRIWAPSTVGYTLYFKDFEITELKNPEYLNKDLLLPETGEGIEAALLGKDIGINESASGIETIASGKNFIFTDSVSGNDNNLVEKNIFIGDAAAGEENILLGKAIIFIDTAEGEDVSNIISGQQQVIVDIGSGEDTVLVNKDLFFNDLASGNEPSVIEKDIFIPEQGAAQENLRIGKAIFVIESASGEDLTEVFTTQIIQNIIDSGSGSDVVLINKNFHLQDNASSQDILSANKDFIFSDNAAGIETLIIKKDLLVEDEGETNDNILTGKVILVLDAAAGAEGLTVIAGEQFYSILRLNSTVNLQLQLKSEVNTELLLNSKVRMK